MNVFAAKQNIVRAICHPTVSTVISTVFRGRIPSRGFRIDTNNRHIPVGNVARLFWGLYEKAEIGFIRQFLRRDLDVVELGCSLGVVSLHIMRMQERGRHLVCVEANPFLIETIHSNHEANARGRSVKVLNRAIDYSGRPEANFSVSENNLASRVDGAEDGRSMSVRATTLSEIVRQHGIGEFALVADIEGAEAGLILKDTEALARCRQIIIELHRTNFEGRPYSVDELREKIESLHGFTLRVSRGDVYVFEKK